MIDEIFTDCVVPASGESDFQLGTDAVGRADEDRVAPSFKRKSGAEAADRSENGWRERFGRTFLDERNSAVGLIDVHARVAITSLLYQRDQFTERIEGSEE
jgi:hypothetical protein